MDVFTENGVDYVNVNGRQFRATRLEAHAANTVGLATTATLAAAVNELTYIQGFDVQWDGTGVGNVSFNAQVNNTVLATLFYKGCTVAGIGGSIGPIWFPNPIPANGANVAITVATGLLANRAGTSVHAYGFRVPLT